MKNKLFITLICIFFAAAIVWGFLRFVIGGSEDSGTGGNLELIISSPRSDQILKSPLSIEGEAKGYWFFEGSFPIKLLDKDGKEIAVGIAQAQGDWMTSDFVPFKAELSFNYLATSSGTLVFEKDNPSGLPENAREMRIPVTIGFSDNIKVKAYFNNDRMDPEFSCNKVFPVEREIPRTKEVARAALEELLKGTTKEEEAEGFFTSINPNVKIQSLTIENGVAKVDFDEQLEFQVGGSCRVAAISWQIRETLKQFSTVKEVIISINGCSEDILQP